jgi:adenine phosphoribosyltransferase
MDDTSTTLDLSTFVRDIPDFPKAGVIFKDITPLLANGPALRVAIDQLSDAFIDKRVDVVVSAEARGFLLGPAVAHHLNAGFVPVRKPGKLPYSTRTITYDLEYGTDSLEMHVDGIHPGQRVLLVDDVLATGGTMRATADLVSQAEGEVVGFGFLIELGFLNGRKVLDTSLPVVSLISY